MSSAEVPPLNAQMHRHAKELFTELVELSTEDRLQRIEKLRETAPELAGEVTSLLDYHTAQSLVAPPSSPKIRTRSTLTTTYARSRLRWLRAPLRGLALALPFFLLGVGGAYWTESSLRQSLSLEARQKLSDAIERRFNELQLWQSAQLNRTSQWVTQTQLVSIVKNMATLAAQPASEDVRKELLASTDQEQVYDLLQKLAGGPVHFSIWDRRMICLADSRDSEAHPCIGDYVTPELASTLLPVLKGDASAPTWRSRRG